MPQPQATQIKQAPALAVEAKLERIIRSLSSVTERGAEIEVREATLKDQGASLLRLLKVKSLDTIYGTLSIRDTKVYDYNAYPEVKKAAEKVAELEKSLKAAKADLEGAQKAAQKDGAPHTLEEKCVAFQRNKAVSARAKGGRIYVRSIFRIRKGAVA